MDLPRTVLVVVGAILVALTRIAGAAPQHAVSVVVEGMSDEEFRRLGGLDLKERVVLRLVEDGFSVTPLAAGPDVQLVIRLNGQSLEIVARGGKRELSKQVSTDRELAAVHLEIVQKAAELVAAIASELPPPSTPDVVAPVPTPPLEIVEQPTPTPTPGHTAVGVAFAGVLRAGGPDPMLAMDMRWRRPRLAWHLTPAVVFAEAGVMSVYEWQVTAAIGLPVERGNWQLEPMLQAGGLVHTFTVRGAAMSSPTGTRIDAVAVGAAELRWTALRPVELTVRFAVGAASARREHVVDGEVVWSRGAVRGEAGFGLALRL